ncbi:MAG TPA: protein kinase, partial [Polyangiaceae bacterium]|nr:protein kinase [Polyangiaceae bacterium]
MRTTLDPSPSGDCLEPEALLEFVGDDAPPSARERVERHVDECAACRRVLSALAGSLRTSSRSANSLWDAPAPRDDADAPRAREAGTSAGDGARGAKGADPSGAADTEHGGQAPSRGEAADGREAEGPGEKGAAGGREAEGPGERGAPEGDSPPEGADTAAPAAGERVGRYRLIERVGEGGMGVVYAARDPELGRKVALKLLRRDRVGGRAGREIVEERLRREAQAMAKLTHPNVAAVYDAGRHGGRVFVAMEFVEGVTLARWLEQKRRSPRQVLEAFVAAGRGLSAAHAAGLVHRDFKP